MADIPKHYQHYEPISVAYKHKDKSNQNDRLEFKCKECGKIYGFTFKNLLKRRKSHIHLCRRCAKVISHDPYRVRSEPTASTAPDIIVGLGPARPPRAEKYPCRKCGKMTTNRFHCSSCLSNMEIPLHTPDSCGYRKTARGEGI